MTVRLQWCGLTGFLRMIISKKSSFPHRLFRLQIKGRQQSLSSPQGLPGIFWHWNTKAGSRSSHDNAFGCVSTSISKHPGEASRKKKNLRSDKPKYINSYWRQVIRGACSNWLGYCGARATPTSWLYFRLKSIYIVSGKLWRRQLLYQRAKQ